ncbi:hypothetical protein K0817_007720 [Microbacterium sp. HD4P20]|uniref:hypothetical protein n=1 Tax=Microbacterium sp. HD4P20 TaxID=2864874 RepID=UPI001C642154|nr:hypothetical protein [Microbacterium sp. HD4P20]MCP2636457.1 hypothetical protein [Microbacterium sp. HD4P20]
MPYTADKPGRTPAVDELRARIPGWGADLNPADRPAFPREQPGLVTGAHWQMPEQQHWQGRAREKSVEHERLTPVFGTAQPLHGLAGHVRRFAYDRYSEGQAAHWLLLIVGDRVDSVTAHARSLFSRHPDDPITQSGMLGERGRRPFASRFRRGRVDLKHTWLDPIVVVGPWVLTAVVVFKVGRSIVRPSSRRG